MGSIVALTDENEQIVERYSYSAFGEMKQLNGVENPYTYTGREWDAETGLYFYRARYYDPEAGRFLSFDPILRGITHANKPSCQKSIDSFPLKTPLGLNPYNYVVGNPLKYTDPWGFAPCPKGEPLTRLTQSG